ncbi:hypothetical protein GF318_03065 [Candidatus Micrarchaeota archaeon]|nr:hypothetical protein [Candidatus Micrarchaeota archaeon]
MRRLLFILLAASLVFANGDEDAFGEFTDETNSFLNDQGQDFVDATNTAGTGVVTTFRSVFDAFGPGQCGDTWVDPDTVFGMWMAPAMFAGMIVVFGLAIVYMIAQLLNSPQLVATVKEEAFQTGLTFIRVIFLMIIISGAQMWYSVNAFATNDDIYTKHPLMIDAAMAFARQMVSDMTKHYSMLLIYNMVIHTIYSSTMWFGVTWRAMYSFNLGPVLKPLIDVVGSALQYLSLGLSSWLLHIVTLCLIKKWMWMLFIPVSMLLRALPFTRNAGEALFALSMALALFYPFMFLFDYEVHKVLRYNIVDAQDAMSNFIHSSGILSVFGPVLVIMFLMAGVFMPFFLGGALNLAFELIRGAVYYIVIISLLLPFLNLFVTLTAAKEIASFFRADVNFMSFLKII